MIYVHTIIHVYGSKILNAPQGIKNIRGGGSYGGSRVRPSGLFGPEPHRIGQNRPDSGNLGNTGWVRIDPPKVQVATVCI